MSRSLISRIEALEAMTNTGRELALLIWGDSENRGALKGYLVGDRFDGTHREILRLPGESDEQLKRRAMAADGEGRRPDDPVRFLWEQRFPA